MADLVKDSKTAIKVLAFSDGDTELAAQILELDELELWERVADPNHRDEMWDFMLTVLAWKSFRTLLTTRYVFEEKFDQMSGYEVSRSYSDQLQAFKGLKGTSVPAEDLDTERPLHVIYENGNLAYTKDDA